MEWEWFYGIGLCRVKVHILAEAVGFENKRTAVSLWYRAEGIRGKAQCKLFSTSHNDIAVISPANTLRHLTITSVVALHNLPGDGPVHTSIIIKVRLLSLRRVFSWIGAEMKARTIFRFFLNSMTL